MKQTTTYKSAANYYALCFMHCALIMACSTDDTATLPAGKYPLEIAAANISVTQTRATADGTWTGNESVGLTVNSGNPYIYTADEDGKLTSTAPYYWQNTDDITVTAWYPYNDGTNPGSSWTVQTDQSGNGYAQSDYLLADAQKVSFTNPTITFDHQVAKVRVVLKAGSGFNDVSDATVSIYDGTQWITANHTSGSSEHNALVLPTTTDIAASTDLVKVNIDGNVYLYTLSSAVSFAKGNVYTYTLTVNKTGLELTSSNITGWTDESETVTGKAGTLGTISVETAGSLTDDEIKAAIEDGNGNVVITGTLDQSDLNIVFNHRNEYTTLDMSGANVSGDNVTFGTYTEGTYIDKCTSLKSVSLPQGLTSIGYFAFYYCTSLTSITIPSSVTSIGNWAFGYCTSLTSITIPSSVTSIDKWAFEYCTSLTSVTCESKTPPTCGTDVFNSHPYDFKIYVPYDSEEKIVEAYKTASGWSKYADYIIAKQE